MAKNLISERLPSDGSFQMHKHLDAANERLNKLGKHGKRCKLKQTGNKVVLQFSFQGRQRQKSNDWSLTKQGIAEAEKIAARVTDWLTANQFSMEWLDALLGKSKPTEAKKQLTCAEMLVEYKKYWFRENKNLKSPNASWYKTYRHIEEELKDIKKTISLDLIDLIVSKTSNNSCTRKRTLYGLINLFDYFAIKDFKERIKKYQDKNKPKQKKKYVPHDGEIMTVYNLGFEVNLSCCQKYRYRYTQWKFFVCAFSYLWFKGS